MPSYETYDTNLLQFNSKYQLWNEFWVNYYVVQCDHKI